MRLFDWFKSHFEAKRAYDLRRVGVQGRPQYPLTDTRSLIAWHRRNELVYSCLQKIAQAVIDPDLIVERRSAQGQWAREDGHPFRRLLVRPNPMQDGASFLASWLVSEHVAGSFYAEIVRSRAGLPVELWPLDPSKVLPIAGSGRGGEQIAAYEFRDGHYRVELPARDVLVSRLPDIGSLYHGLAPLAVALGAVDADAAQTDYIRAFFDNAGVPSGIIKIKGRALSQEQAEGIQERWLRRHSRRGKLPAGPAVLDENAEYQKIGANLDELESNTMRAVLEARICTVFGVPPLLVGAYVGLQFVNQRATAEAALKDFWTNKMSPTLKRIRSFLTWRLLAEFEGEEAIYAERVRLNWDMSRVAALAEDESARHQRIREDFLAGLMTKAEARAQLGLSPGE
ncbi:MAG TPA: phage portal protein [Blastocatellia bacterium]|nr:phage portal protein [Blastocatellia bacterium]